MALPFSLPDDLEAEPSVPNEINESPRLCRITLAADAPHPIVLPWHPGTGPGVRSKVTVLPGHSTTEQLYKAESWFGPFTLPERYAKATDENVKAALQSTWRTEKKRALDRYDYPRIGGTHADMRIVGPHRFPDVTVQVIEGDGTEHAPIRLHELYKIGEFDTTPIEVIEQPADVRAEYEERLAAKDAEVAALRREMAALAGQVKGFIAGMATTPPEPEAKAGKRETATVGAP